MGINQSINFGCFHRGGVSPEEVIMAAARIGYKSVEMLDRKYWDMVKDNGLEIAIDDTTTDGYHDTGALYDLVRPSRNAMKPVGQWNQLELTCRGQQVTVVLNGQKILSTDLDRFQRKNLRPDGTRHKFPFAYKDHPREGYIGLQDHGADCWYKNIKLRVLRRGPAKQ
mgnify:CR=1 FL=1